MPDKTALKYSLTNSNKYVWTYDLFLLVDIIQTILHCIIHNANQYEQKPFKTSWLATQKQLENKAKSYGASPVLCNKQSKSFSAPDL